MMCIFFVSMYLLLGLLAAFIYTVRYHCAKRRSEFTRRPEGIEYVFVFFCFPLYFAVILMSGFFKMFDKKAAAVSKRFK